ncbi:BACON domain-containing carbohydrate-binding protein [Bacteroides sp.]|uniref:BACON domain-containing protein n=1 Tax=Bacteroides sp. TaxID=29523 RepID=UPI002FC8DB24
MKKNIIIIAMIGTLGLSSGIVSCSPDYQTEFEKKTLVVSDKNQSPILFPLEGGERQIYVETNVEFTNWQAESNAEWCQIERQQDKVIVSVGKNEIYKVRMARISISYGYQAYDIVVTQFGLEPAILVGEEGKQDGYIKEIGAQEKKVSIPVRTNLNLDNIIVPDTVSWLKFSKISAVTRAPENISAQELQFELDQNTDTVVRYCTVTLQSSENYNFTSTFLIKQQKRGYIVEADESVLNQRIEASGKTITIPFNINGPAIAYTYEIEEEAKEWIVPTPASRALRAASESFVIKPNIKEQERIGRITFRSPDASENSSFVVTVTQDKFIPVAPQNILNPIATPGAGFINLKWQMPDKVDFTKISIEYYDAVQRKTIKKEINDNTTTGFIIDHTYKAAGEYSFKFMTYGPTGMETETPVSCVGTSNESARSIKIDLTAAMISANATQSGDGQGIPGLIDGVVTTYYHTLWSAVSPGGKPHYVQFNLKEPIQTFSIEYDGRHNGDGGGDVKRAGVWVSTTGANVDSDWVKAETINFTMPTSRGGHATPDKQVEADKAYKYIRFIPEARRNADPLVSSGQNGWWNMANIYLYKINFQDEAWAKKELGL